MDNAVGPRQLQEEVYGAEERQWLQVSLARTQLLSVRFAQDIDTRVVSGRHWISTDGVDLAIGPGERVKLPAGLALIDGEGVLQLALANGPGTCVPYPFSWRLDQLFKRRAMALEININ
jgi:hypothetical protein